MTAKKPASLPTLLDSPSSSPKNILISDIIALRKRGMTHKEIGKLLNRSSPNITMRLQQADVDLQSIDNYKTHKADTLAYYQHKILSKLTDSDIEKASAYQKVGMIALLSDKEALTRGQATAIVDHRHVTATLADLRDRQAQLRRELGYEDDRGPDSQDDNVIDIESDTA